MKKTLSSLRALREALRFLWLGLDSFARRHLIWSFSLMIFLALLGALTPLVMNLVLDSFSQLEKAGRSQLFTPMFLVTGFVITQYLVNSIGALRAYIHSIATQRLRTRLSSQLFRHIQQLPMRLHLDRKSGGVSHIMTQGMSGYEILLQHVLFTIMPVVLQLVAIIAVLMNLEHGKYLIIFAVSAVAYLLVFLDGAARIVEPARATNDTCVEVNSTLTDNLLNYEIVKYFNAGSFVSDRYDQLLHQSERHSVQLFRTFMVNGQLIALISGLCLGVTLIYAGGDVLAGAMTVGGFVLLNSYATQILQPIQTLGSAVRDLSQAVVDFEKMLEILREPREQSYVEPPGARDLSAPQPTGVRGEIKLENVSFAYPAVESAETKFVLNDISFTIRAGETVAVVGKSGSGKSTLARLLFRLFNVQKGQIFLDGVPITQLNHEVLREAIGIVPQDTILFNASIGYNIGFGKPGSSQEEIEQAAKVARLHDFVMTLPQQYDTNVGERGIRLSGGEKQRVSIARVALRCPPVVIFDEATSSLDTKTEREILLNLQELSHSRTTLAIAHRLSTIIHADLIIVLDSGVIVERGTHDELVKKPNGIYADMWDKQQSNAAAASSMAAAAAPSITPGRNALPTSLTASG